MKKEALILLSAMLLFISKSNAQTPVDFSKIDNTRIESDPAVTWRQFGPGGSGNNYYLFWHPTDPNIVFQGPNMYNAYRSVNRGETYHGILDDDGPGYKTGERGPIEINTPDFSRQEPNFGFCTMELYSRIYETNDTGASWTMRTDINAQLEGQMINTIVVDPTDDNIWYAGSGSVSDANRFVFTNDKPHGFNSSVTNHQAKIWKTIDRGDTWIDFTPSSLNSDAQIVRIMVHPVKPNTLFIATTYGFYKSIDGGGTWEAKNTGFDNNIIRSVDMHYDEATGKVCLYAIDLVKYIPDGTSINYSGGIFKSTDEGEIWTKINSNMPLPNSILSDYTVKTSIYKTALSDWFGKTQDEVEDLYPTLPTTLLHSVSKVRVDPTNPNKVLVLNNYKSQYTFKGGMMWRTEDGGNSWFVTFRNGTNWEGADKSIWESRGNPTSHNVDYRAQKEWELRDTYDQKAGATVEFNSDGSVIMFQVAKVVCVSEDGGDTWVENDEVDTLPDQQHWVGGGNSNLPGADIIQDSRIDHTYLCSGENSIWRTTEDGENVRENAQAVYKMNIPSKADPEECSVSSMVIHPNDVNTLYSVHYRQAFSGKLMKSSDAGANWEEHGKVLDFPTDITLSNATIHQLSLIIDPDNVNKFYVTIPQKTVNDLTYIKSGNLVEPFGVYRSVDGGVTFDKINDGFPSVSQNKLRVQKLMLDPINKGVLYAAVTGQAGGLYRLDNNSDVWEGINIPDGVTDVNDVFITNDNLYISCGSSSNTDTNIGGVWVSNNRGESWKQVFKSWFANLIRVATYDPDVLLVSIPSSDMINPGIYRSLDGGNAWSKINVGNLQSDRLNDLEIDIHQKGVYWCSTYGAGFYKGIDPSLLQNVSTKNISAKPEYEFTIYPNPTNNGVVSINNYGGDGQVSLFDMNGRLVHISNIRRGTSSIPIEHLKDGMYSVQLVTTNNISTRKLIIRK